MIFEGVVSSHSGGYGTAPSPRCHKAQFQLTVLWEVMARGRVWPFGGFSQQLFTSRILWTVPSLVFCRKVTDFIFEISFRFNFLICFHRRRRQIVQQRVIPSVFEGFKWLCGSWKSLIVMVSHLVNMHIPALHWFTWWYVLVHLTSLWRFRGYMLGSSGESNPLFVRLRIEGCIVSVRDPFWVRSFRTSHFMLLELHNPVRLWA